MLKIILLLIFATGCGVDNEQAHPKTIEKNFGKYGVYVDRFIEIATQAGIDSQLLDNNNLVAITYFENAEDERIDKSAIGVCFSGDSSTIKIKKSFEETATVQAIKWVLFHEMGHCLFNAKHSDDWHSLMTPSLPLDVYLASDISDIAEHKAEHFMQDYLDNKIAVAKTAEPLVINR